MKAKYIKLKEWISFHTGSDPDFSIEHRLFNVVAYFAGLIGLMTVGINFIVDSTPGLTILSGIITIMSWGTFYLSRFMKRFELSRWILTVFLFVLFGYIYFLNNGSQGPMLLLYLVYFLLLIFVWKGRARIFFISLFILNILVYFFIELKYPSLIQPYETERFRVMDVYLSFFMYVVLGGVILLFAKNSYEKEKLKAEKSDLLKSAFLANMSHEIRTPMNAILGFTQLLQRDLPKSKKDAYLQVIQENSYSLLRLIEDIIDVSKIEVGELKIKELDVDLNDLILKVGLTFRQLLNNYPDKEVEIIETLPDDSLFVLADNARLTQVLVNLLSNALKNTEKGSIEIGCIHQNEWIRFYVRDTGIGIRDEHVKEIFERFRKIETDDSQTIQPGAGIGLSISRNLVRLMGGEIGVDSEFGKGSEFYFTIPYHPSIEKVPVRQKKEQVVDLNNADLTGTLILIAEDERTNFEFLKRVIERTGAEVIHAKDGKEAVDVVKRDNNIDLVLMDIMMPVMNGYEAAKAIKEINPGIPIIAQTALAMEGDAQKVLDSGCDDYISKPIRINELIVKITNHIPIKKSLAS